MDVYNTNWNEADASNSTAAPDGWPEGMAPSGVNDSGRAMMGAVKRYVDQQIPLVMGGTSTAYTLSYSVAPSQLYDGMTHLVQFNAVNGVAPTLNVNGLGAKPLHFWASGGWGAWPANMVAIDQIVRVTYNAAAGTYRAVGMPTVLNQSVSGVTAIDFTGIPANVNNLQCFFEFVVGTNTAALELRTYGADGVLDTGASDYGYVLSASFSGTAAPVMSGAAASAAIFLTNGLNSNPQSAGGTLGAMNIQAATATKFVVSVFGLDQGGSQFGLYASGGERQETDRITGFRLFPSTGTVTGKVSVVMS